LTAETNAPTGGRTTDAGFTLPELLIVVVIMGLLMPVLAMAFSVVVRTNPTSSDRADDSRSLGNLTNWVSQDVSSTRENGFFIGASAPTGGCLASSLPASSVNLLELHWNEGSKGFVTNYRWVPTNPSKGRIFRYACLQGQPAVGVSVTAELNEIASGQFGRAPVEITRSPTTLADGSSGTKGVQFVVLILDSNGVQRELLSLDATTTNVLTTLPGSAGGSGGTNTAPIVSDLAMTITPPATLIDTLQATDPDGDILFTTFPNGVPAGWNLRATEVTIEVTPDPAAAPGLYVIDYRVTDPSGASADARLNVTIAAVTPNQPPIANALSLNATKSLPSVGTLVFSDPEGETLVPVLNTADIPTGWTATVSGNQVTVTPSASATGATVIRYSVTDSAGATTTSQITVNVCTVSLVSVSPASRTVAVKGNGDLFNDVTVEIASNGACSALVLGFLPNTSLVESTESFNASNVVTIRTNSATWTRPANGATRVVALNVRLGANGPIQLSLNLTTTR
jgi:prepilin-type N-terminal cleavage/methylation domain-containing protein